MEFSLMHLLVLLVVVFVLFGAGRLPKVMGDLGKGMRSFKEGLAEEERKENAPPMLPQAPLPIKEMPISPPDSAQKERLSEKDVS